MASATARTVNVFDRQGDAVATSLPLANLEAMGMSPPKVLESDILNQYLSPAPGHSIGD